MELAPRLGLGTICRAISCEALILSEHMFGVQIWECEDVRHQTPLEPWVIPHSLCSKIQTPSKSFEIGYSKQTHTHTHTHTHRAYPDMHLSMCLDPRFGPTFCVYVLKMLGPTLHAEETQAEKSLNTSNTHRFINPNACFSTIHGHQSHRDTPFH